MKPKGNIIDISRFNWPINLGHFEGNAICKWVVKVNVHLLIESPSSIVSLSSDLILSKSLDDPSATPSLGCRWITKIGVWRGRGGGRKSTEAPKLQLVKKKKNLSIVAERHKNLSESFRSTCNVALLLLQHTKLCCREKWGKKEPTSSFSELLVMAERTNGRWFLCGRSLAFHWVGLWQEKMGVRWRIVAALWHRWRPYKGGRPGPRKRCGTWSASANDHQRHTKFLAFFVLFTE